jgi:predicted secreted protein
VKGTLVSILRVTTLANGAKSCHEDCNDTTFENESGVSRENERVYSVDVNRIGSLSLCAFVMLNGCGRPSGKPMEVQLSEAANGSEVSLSVGQAFTLALPENRTTGYSWQVSKNGRPVCRLVDDSREQNSKLIGAPGVHKWRFVAEKPGAGTIELHLVRPWEANDIRRSLSLNVRVN